MEKSMKTPPLIHVVDDDDSLRTALLRLLAAAGFEARGYASAGEFLLHPVADRPGCLLLDVRLPGPSGLDLQSAMPEHGVTLPVIFMTGHADVPTSVQAMKAGAVDFLEKPVQRERLLEVIGQALALGQRQRSERDEAAALRRYFSSLTPREKEVVDGVVAGQLNKQIAAEMRVSERTVKSLRAQAMDKLGASSSAELGALAERLRRMPDA
jgi:FixJ family two-component response regulator